VCTAGAAERGAHTAMMRARHCLARALAVLGAGGLARAQPAQPDTPPPAQPATATPPPHATAEGELTSDTRAAIELVAGVALLSALICIMAVAIVWRKKNAVFVGAAAAARQRRGRGPARWPELIDVHSRSSTQCGDEVEGRTGTGADSLPRRQEGAGKSGGSGFSRSLDVDCCQMCLERPRSVLVLPCRCVPAHALPVWVGSISNHTSTRNTACAIAIGAEVILSLTAGVADTPVYVSSVRNGSRLLRLAATDCASSAGPPLGVSRYSLSQKQPPILQNTTSCGLSVPRCHEPTAQRRRAPPAAPPGGPPRILQNTPRECSCS